MRSGQDCLIESSKRRRVNGPYLNRNQLRTFHKLGDVTPQLLNTLNGILDVRKNQNDLGGDCYKISGACNYSQVFNAGRNYRQILLQHSDSDSVTVDEMKYKNWVPQWPLSSVRDELWFFKNMYRFRLVEMAPDHELNWHIDTDTSVLCRAQICLNDNDSIFEFRRRNTLEQLKMKPGELWFINVGWSHRVLSNTKTRRSAIFSFELPDLIDAKMSQELRV